MEPVEAPLNDDIHQSIHKRWTLQEDTLLREWAGIGLSARNVARYLKRTRNAVLGRAHRLGVRFWTRNRVKTPSY